MAGFTNIGIGTDWQAASVMKELQQGLIERVLAIGGFTDWATSTVYAIDDIRKNDADKEVYRCIEAHTSGDFFEPAKWENWTTMLGKDLQGRIFNGQPNGNVEWYGWKYMQETLESICTSFVNHTVDLTTVGEPTMYTLATWRSVAGISSQGFKRSTTSPWDGSYGVMEAGDVINTWIFDEIQAGLSALKWTKIGVIGTGASSVIDGVDKNASDDGTPCDTALSNYITAWSGAGWSGQNSHYYLVFQSRNYDDFLGRWTFDARRMRSKARVSDVEDVSFEHTAHCWYYADIGGTAGIQTFQDVDGITNGLNKLWLVEDFASSTDTSHTTALYGEQSGDPLIYTCPIAVGGNIAGVFSGAAYWIMKWVFTNSD